MCEHEYIGDYYRGCKHFHGRYYTGEKVDCGSQTCKTSAAHIHPPTMNCRCPTVRHCPIVHQTSKTTLTLTYFVDFPCTSRRSHKTNGEYRTCTRRNIRIAHNGGATSCSVGRSDAPTGAPLQPPSVSLSSPTQLHTAATALLVVLQPRFLVICTLHILSPAVICCALCTTNRTILTAMSPRCVEVTGQRSSSDLRHHPRSRRRRVSAQNSLDICASAPLSLT
ncbi:hypothetical protein C8Q78DRAFT_224898 [Trametes maxima]|nr:hypothetical protein C8Q78DRAFT_224898 [Trametes maxima]